MTDAEYDEALRSLVEKASKRNADERQQFASRSNQLQQIILSGTQEDLNVFANELDEFSDRRGEATDEADGSSSPPVS